MRLFDPIDFAILTAFRDKEICDYSAPTRIAYLANQDQADGEEFSTDYVNSRMSSMRDLELLRRLEPENSGLYQLTNVGRVALNVWESEGRREFELLELIKKADELE